MTVVDQPGQNSLTTAPGSAASTAEGALKGDRSALPMVPQSPLATAGAPAAGRQASTTMPSRISDGQVAVMDDDDIILMSNAQFFIAGLKLPKSDVVSVHSTGQSARSLAETIFEAHTSKPLSLLFTDFNLMNCDSAQVVSELRTMFPEGKLPFKVALYSGTYDPHDLDAIRAELKPDLHIRKPASLTDIRAQLSTILELPVQADRLRPVSDPDGKTV